MVDHRATISLAVAHNTRDAVATAWPAATFRGDAEDQSSVVIAAANERSQSADGLAPIVRAQLPFDQRRIPIVGPISLTRLTWKRPRHGGDDSTAVDLRGRGGRLLSVRLETTIATAGTLIAVNDLRGETAPRPAIALGVWGRFTHLRDRIGLTLSSADRGANAEIALAVQPALIVLVEQWRGQTVAIISADQIAAELAALALRQSVNRSGDDEGAIGPWEDPLIQRATELQLGVLLPTQVSIEGCLSDGRDPLERVRLQALLDDVAPRIGVADVRIRP